jgi:hypothetical protein
MLASLEVVNAINGRKAVSFYECAFSRAFGMEMAAAEES